MGSSSATMDKVVLYVHKHGALPSAEKGKPLKLNGETIRSTSIEGLMRRKILDENGKLTEDIGLNRAKSLLAENIDAPRSTSRFQVVWGDQWRVTFDIGETNHKFWDKARRGDATGLEIAGLFLKPIASKKAAWVLGEAPKLKFETSDTESTVNQWFMDWHAQVVLAMEESANLGDMYLVVNPDLSISLVPPHVVTPLMAKEDFSKQVGWRIKQTFALPQNSMLTQIIQDDFTARKRTRTITQAGKVVSKIDYPNPAGKIPIVHIANDLRANEKFGHPAGEALLKALWQYNEIFVAAIEGNIKQGRPVAVFEKMGGATQVEAFMRNFAQAKTETLSDGSERTYYEIDFTSLLALGETGEFNFKQPGSFTADTVNLLGLLFYLIVQHSEMPEFIFGNAIASSKASAESQMPPFIKWVEKEQGRATFWLKELIEIFMGYAALSDRSINPSEEFSISWPSLTEGDGKLTLEATLGAYDRGLLTEEVTIQQLQRFLTIEDATAMLDQIKKERDEARARDEEPFVPPMDDEDDSPEDENGEAQEAEIVRVARKSLQEAEHRGVMLAFELDQDSAIALANATRQAGIEAVSPEDMHLTLCFLGDAAGWNHKRSDIENTLMTFAFSHAPVEGRVGGTGRFVASATSDGMDVLYASFDAPELPEFRQDLVKVLSELDVEVSRAHGYTPHITLAYVEKGAELPHLALESMEFCFRKVTLYWGDERISFELKKELEAEVA
jgi:2'-5' RNA ligase